MVRFGRCGEDKCGMEGLIQVLEGGCGSLEVEFDGMDQENKVDKQECEE